MTILLPMPPGAASPVPMDPYDWLGRVLTHFAAAERAIGQLCIALDLPVEKGPLSSLQTLCERLARHGDRRCHTLCRRIERWRALRPLRHLLAHASVLDLRDATGKRFIATRHLPLNRDDITPDRLWTPQECQTLLRIAASDSRSIGDHVRNLLQNSAVLAELKKQGPGAGAV